MFECEQVDKSVTPQHLIWKIRRTRLKYENSFLLSSKLQNRFLDLDRVSRLLHDALEHDYNLVAPLEEVLGAHVVEGAVRVDLVDEGGRPDEEQLILLSFTVSPDLDKSQFDSTS